MDKIDELLMYVQKTNPGMTREKLIDELNKSDYAAKALLFGLLLICSYAQPSFHCAPCLIGWQFHI